MNRKPARTEADRIARWEALKNKVTPVRENGLKHQEPLGGSKPDNQPSDQGTKGLCISKQNQGYLESLLAEKYLDVMDCCDNHPVLVKGSKLANVYPNALTNACKEYGTVEQGYWDGAVKVIEAMRYVLNTPCPKNPGGLFWYVLKNGPRNRRKAV